MPRRWTHRRRLAAFDRLLGTAGIIAVTAWVVGARPAPVQVQVVAPPGPAAVATVRAASGRCARDEPPRFALAAPAQMPGPRTHLVLGQAEPRRSPPRDPFTSPVIVYASRRLPAERGPRPAPMAPAPERGRPSVRAPGPELAPVATPVLRTPAPPLSLASRAPVPPAPSPPAPVSTASVALTPAQPLPERRIRVAGHALSTAGLSRAQVRLLETVARLPALPTETLRGTRFVRFGGRLYRDDCSNVLRVPYAAQGIDLFSEAPRFPDSNGVGLIRAKGTRVTAPRVGDLVIFDDTWDRNRNGERDDPDTHAAIVIGFEPGGTVLLYNRVRTGHRVFRMNLRHPDRLRDPETRARLNDFLRRRRRGDPKSMPRLTGALFARYVRVL